MTPYNVFFNGALLSRVSRGRDKEGFGAHPVLITWR